MLTFSSFKVHSNSTNRNVKLSHNTLGDCVVTHVYATPRELNYCLLFLSIHANMNG